MNLFIFLLVILSISFPWIMPLVWLIISLWVIYCLSATTFWFLLILFVTFVVFAIYFASKPDTKETNKYSKRKYKK